MAILLNLVKNLYDKIHMVYCPKMPDDFPILFSPNESWLDPSSTYKVISEF